MRILAVQYAPDTDTNEWRVHLVTETGGSLTCRHRFDNMLEAENFAQGFREGMKLAAKGYALDEPEPPPL